jgi:hypothetical protein
MPTLIQSHVAFVPFQPYLCSWSVSFLRFVPDLIFLFNQKDTLFFPITTFGYISGFERHIIKEGLIDIAMDGFFPRIFRDTQPFVAGTDSVL